MGLQICWFLVAAAAQISLPVWAQFLLEVAAAVSAHAIIAIAGYLAWRVRCVGQSGDQPQLDRDVLKADAWLRATYARLATVAPDPRVAAVLLHLAAGTDPSAALAALLTNAADRDPTGEPRQSGVPMDVSQPAPLPRRPLPKPQRPDAAAA